VVAQEAELARTLAERAADIIRSAIVTLSPGYRPGTRLYPHLLAESLGISVTPVREALKLLVAEGLIELSPRRGFSVIRLSREELDDLLSVRAGLEALALRFRDGRLTPAEIAQLEDCLDACEQALAAADLETCWLNDGKFHRLIVEFSGSPRLRALYETVLHPARMMEVYNPSQADTLREGLREHRALLAQFATGAPEQSAPALLEHWEQSRIRLHGKYAALPPEDIPSNWDGVALLPTLGSVADE
jgi:DNA-binding GntR family transcriptional regulator